MPPTRVWAVYGSAIPASSVLMTNALLAPLEVTALLDLLQLHNALQEASAPILQLSRPVPQDTCVQAAAQLRFSAPQAHTVWQV